MDWNDFAKRLTLELSRLPVTSFLIVQGPSGLPYVQAMRAEGLLDAEAVGSAFMPRPLAPRQERRLRSLGWEPPDDEERKNWWHQFTLRDRGGARASAEHLEASALLAGLMVGAFRDVYRIESPVELVYQASRSGPQGGPLALPGLGIPLAVPDDESRRAAAARSPRPSGSTLENALAEARERGDQQSYLQLLARAVLYLPASGAPGDGEHQFATARFGDGTFVLAFTSPEAMDRSLQGQAVHHREATLSELGRHWPHADWQLAVNPGLPSASYLDANALFEPDEPRRSAGTAPPAAGDVRVAGVPPTAPGGGSPARDGFTAGHRTPGPSQSAPPPRPEAPAPSAVPAAAQAPPRPPGDTGAPRRESPAPSPTASFEAPAGGEAAAVREAHRTRETAGDLGGLPAPGAPPAGRDRGTAETPSRPGTAPPVPEGREQQPVPDVPAVGRDRGAAETPRRPADVPPVPEGRGQQPVRDVPVAGRQGDVEGERRRAGAGEARRPSSAAGRGRADGAPQVVMMQKVVRPEHVQHYLEGAYDLVAGYVHMVEDVRELTSPAALIRGLGLVYEGSPFTPMDEEIHVIRWPAVKPSLFRRPLGGIDEWSMGIISGGWVIERAPFPGSGYAPGDGPAIAEFKIESQRLPHGAELHRIAADGPRSRTARYDADLRSWVVRPPEGRE